MERGNNKKEKYRGVDIQKKIEGVFPYQKIFFMVTEVKFETVSKAIEFINKIKDGKTQNNK